MWKCTRKTSCLKLMHFLETRGICIQPCVTFNKYANKYEYVLRQECKGQYQLFFLEATVWISPKNDICDMFCNPIKVSCFYWNAIFLLYFYPINSWFVLSVLLIDRNTKTNNKICKVIWYLMNIVNANRK